ncbi:hypothetical protein EDM76_11555 [bacterium]|nr:MAG: hypothetical protein EDM76_11555 [bacterium]
MENESKPAPGPDGEELYPVVNVAAEFVRIFAPEIERAILAGRLGKLGAARPKPPPKKPEAA